MAEGITIEGELVEKLNFEVKPGDIIWNVEKQTLTVPFPTDYIKLYRFLKFQREASLEEKGQWKSERSEK